MKDEQQLATIATYLRTLILKASTRAGSGHPTSSLSATELMVGLMFGGTFRTDLNDPKMANNDRLIFSKGHASPLYYSLWVAAGAVTEADMMTYRDFDSALEGHPTARFPYVDAATGSLGQGLAIGVGHALNGKYLDKLPYRTYVLLGDSEMAEGAQWEAIQLASHYQLDNLVGILDVNRLGQRGETMIGRQTDGYRKRMEAFGWLTRCIDGHSLSDVCEAYTWASAQRDAPCMIIAQTVKGKGVSFLENQDGWHGKALDEDQLAQALDELGDAEAPAPSPPAQAAPASPASTASQTNIQAPGDSVGDEIATRKAFGNALQRIYPKYPNIVALDGEVCNSTHAQDFRDTWPERFFEMYVAEQNMVGTAIGLSSHGKIPFVSTFAAFLTRAFDQIRMAPYSNANIKFVGSHAGVSIGQDGPSQMGLEDIAMFRTLPNSVVLYPCDAVSAEKMVEAMANHVGISYLRTTRGKTPVIYAADEEFPIGGCKVLRASDADQMTVVAAGITLHEALAAYNTLKDRGVSIRVIDLYSIKPLDAATLRAAASDTGVVLTVEDHYGEGGIGEAVAAALAEHCVPVISRCVRKQPRSGTTRELLDYENISETAIVTAVEEILKSKGERT